MKIDKEELKEQACLHVDSCTRLALVTNGMERSMIKLAIGNFSGLPDLSGMPDLNF
jgi:hypothetical protein